jgi:tetratricopeptide (TPR) repeat protein
LSPADDGTILRCLEMLDSRGYDAIIGFCDDRIRGNPHDPFSYFFRGIAQRNKKEFDGALQDFQHVLRLDPKSAPAYNQLEITILEKHGFSLEPKEREEAIRHFTKAIELDPRYAEAYLQRARCYDLYGTRWHEKRLAEDSQKKALADYDQLIKLRPRGQRCLRTPRLGAFQTRKP